MVCPSQSCPPVIGSLCASAAMVLHGEGRQAGGMSARRLERQHWLSDVQGAENHASPSTHARLASSVMSCSRRPATCAMPMTSSVDDTLPGEGGERRTAQRSGDREGKSRREATGHTHTHTQGGRAGKLT